MLNFFLPLLFLARAICCVNNDKAVRIYDLVTLQLLKKFQFPWAVNVGTRGRLMMIVNMSVRANLEITHRVDWKTFVNPRIF